MIHHQVWYWLEEINDVLVPGPGQLVGFGKKDVFGPIDLIPIIGPARKLHKVSKVWKHRRKVKQGVYWGLNLAADVFAVKEGLEWFNSRTRYFNELIVEAEEEESSSPSHSGNADEEISGGGGTKKKKGSSRIRYRPYSKQHRCQYHRVKNKRTGGWTWALGRQGPQCVKYRRHPGKHAARWKTAFGKGQ